MTDLTSNQIEELNALRLDLQRLVDNFNKIMNVRDESTNQQISVDNQQEISHISTPSNVKIDSILTPNTLITNADIENFIETKCILDLKYSTIMSDLRDAYNKHYDRNISLISFSKKFNEVSDKYHIKRVQKRVGAKSGIWFVGIGIKP
jgi:hypothetical protein